MTYEQQIKMIVTFLYNETKCFATSNTYHIPYKKIESAYGLWVGTEIVECDIREEFGKNHLDRIQALDFDNIKEEVVVMIWESNNKKKYTLKNWKEFCDDALVMPPFENDEQLEEWFDTHKIHIAANNCVMELEYDADAVNEIEFALQEINEAINGDGTPTTGNTVGSQYRPAEFKDVVRYYIMEQYENYGGLNWFEYARMAESDLCNMDILRGVYQRISDIGVSLYKEMGCDFSRFDPFSFCDATKEGIRNIVYNWVGSDIEMSYDPQTDKTFLIDYTFKESGDFIGWCWGPMTEEDIEYKVECYRTLIFEEE